MPQHIVFAIDDSYVRQLAALLSSIFAHASRPCEFYALYEAIGEKHIELLSDFVRANGSRISFIKLDGRFDLTKLQGFLSIRKNYAYITRETFFRFYIADIFGHLDKILYLDADCLLMDDVGKLYAEDISGCMAAAAQDNWQQYLVERQHIRPAGNKYKNYREYYKVGLCKKETRYFNAGVMLFNPRTMAWAGVGDLLLRTAANNPPFEYQDQDIFNMVLEGKVKYLDARWNVLKDLKMLVHFYRNSHARAEAARALANPGIIHFAGRDKPWLADGAFHFFEYVEAWWNSYRRAPFYKPDDEKIYEKIMAAKGTLKYNALYMLKKLNLGGLKSAFCMGRNVWRRLAG